MDRSAQCTLTSLASLSCMLLFALGCLEQVDVDLPNQAGELSLSPDLLRPDYRALGNQPRSGDRATYSDGNAYDDRGNRIGTGGTAPLSPLRFADIDGALNDQLRRAACLWVDRGNESARISYEMIAYDVSIPEYDAVVEQTSVCGGYLVDPRTRDVVEFENMESGEVEELIGGAGDFFDVEMTIHRGTPSRDPRHACDAGDPGIAGLPTRVVSLNGLAEQPISFPGTSARPTYPFCMNQGALPRVDEDWSMQLDMINPDTGSAFSLEGVNSPPFVLPTRIKVVPPSTTGSEFLISRPLRYLGRRDARVDGDRTITPIGFTWRAAILGDGRWEENFSPNLAISRIRVFRDLGIDPDTGEMIREYLSANAIDAYSDPGLLRGDREVRCDFEAGNGEEPAACLDAVGFTPTYRIDRDNVGTRLTDLLTWVVEWDEIVECRPFQRPDGTLDCMDVVVESPPVGERDRDLYVEFHLVRPSTATSGQGLMVRPAASDFGDVDADRQPLFENVFEVQNWGQGAIRVTGVALEGSNAVDFEIQPDPAKLVGTRIEMGATLSLDVRVVSDSRHHGRREARLRISAEDIQGRPMSVRANLRATVVDWIFNAVHTPFVFFRHTAQHPWDDTRQWQKALLLVNSGAMDMPRQQITITGPGAAHWSVVRETSEYLPPADYVPWIWGEEPPRERTVVPGGSELLWVLYHPSVPYLRSLQHGPDEAEIRIQVDDAEYRIPLVGHCVDRCEFRAPSPYAPPSRGGGGVKVIVGAQTPALAGGGLIEAESMLAPAGS